MARFWSKILTITFVVGVVTGIPLEFQFGTNWAFYSRFVGDIFGAPLAAEGIFSFFLESVFIAVLVYGWNRFSVKTLWFASLMVAIGATLSGFWIIVANSWMQTPAGYHLMNGRAELVNFWAAIFNPSTLPRYFHTICGAFMTAAFFITGVAAFLRLKGRRDEFVTRALKAGLVVAFVASVAQLGLGHWHAIQVAHTQPEKLAAIEGIFETQKSAPALLFGIPDADEETMRAAVRIPGLLSLLAFGSFDAEVMGLKEFAKEMWPPLSLTFYPFHLMIALGMYFIAFGALGTFLLWKKRLFESKWFLKLALFSIPLPFIANELGWMTAEVGRQPWAVYHIIETRDAVSASVPAGQILFTIIMFSIIYIFLFALWIYLLRSVIASETKQSHGIATAPPATIASAGRSGPRNDFFRGFK
jgi:cytochrome d ubiquinol oxidase subunit I